MKDELLYRNGDGWLAIRRTCDCGKELQRGTITVLGLDQVHWYGWICPEHGEVKPAYQFLDNKRQPLGDK
jgi:hypothetical protein